MAEIDTGEIRITEVLLVYNIKQLTKAEEIGDITKADKFRKNIKFYNNKLKELRA